MKTLFFILLLVLPGIGIAQAPISHERLIEVLPKKVAQCKLIGSVQGATLNMESMSVTNASANYGSESVQIEIVFMDYYGSEEAYKNSILTSKEQSTLDSEQTKIAQYELDAKKAWFFQNENEKAASLMVVWESRYYLNIAVNGTIDQEFLNSIYEELDFSKME